MLSTFTTPLFRFRPQFFPHAGKPVSPGFYRFTISGSYAPRQLSSGMARFARNAGNPVFGKASGTHVIGNLTALLPRSPSC